MLIISLHTLKWLQVLKLHTNYSIQNNSFICTQLNSSAYCYLISIIQLDLKEFQTELFEKELFICIKMDLVLNNLQ